MNVQEQIENYLTGLPEPKCRDMKALHDSIQRVCPECKLWFLDGTDDRGKIVSNPNIGYGTRDHRYADGSSREFYQVGLSANTTGISVYIMGLKDKKYLAETFAKDLGKASITGYCIKFKTLKDIDLSVLEEAIRYGLETSQNRER
jgi:hypothetical protein